MRTSLLLLALSYQVLAQGPPAEQDHASGGLPTSGELPAYTGPYGVGIIDVEVAGDGTVYGNYTFKDSGRPAYQLDTILTTIYYPTEKSYKTNRAPHYWIPKPFTILGEERPNDAADLDNGWPMRGAGLMESLQAFVENTTIPAAVDAPLAAEGGPFPALVFSHDTGEMATWYSTFCGELASRGHIVASVHHRDGSAIATRIQRIGARARTMSYWNGDDVDPPATREEYFAVRFAFRTAEILEVARMLTEINNGNGDRYYRDNFFGEGIEFEDWRDRIDVNRLVVGGHGMGGDAAIAVFGDNTTRPDVFAGSILFDPTIDLDNVNATIPIPFVIANSAESSLSGYNFYAKVLADSNHGWFLTNPGTTRYSFTDFAAFFPKLFYEIYDSFAPTAWTDPPVAMSRYVDLAATFFRFLGPGAPRQGVLAAEAAYPEYVNETGMEMDWQVHTVPPVLNDGATSNSGTTNGTGVTGGSDAALGTGTAPTGAAVGMHPQMGSAVIATVIAMGVLCAL